MICHTKLWKKILKKNSQSKNVKRKSVTEMTPKEWAQMKIWFGEAPLSDLEKWSDGGYPAQGSFDMSKLDSVRGYLVENKAGLIRIGI